VPPEPSAVKPEDRAYWRLPVVAAAAFAYLPMFVLFALTTVEYATGVIKSGERVVFGAVGGAATM